MRSSVSRALILVLAIPILLSGPSLDACTTFCLKGGDSLVFGRNYDWAIGVGLVIANKRDLSKTGMVTSQDRPLEWISKYGSITFNQYGRELPMGGINEAGLVVEQMWLSDTRYPNPDDRPALRELAWIQYQLDTCASVDEVIAGDSKVRISSDSVPIHFLVCDRTGRVATIEFLEGKMVVHRADTLPVTALANSTYAASMNHLKNFEGFGGERKTARTTGSLDRFVRAAQGIKRHTADQDEGMVENALAILKKVSQGPSTQWSIVYDVKNLALHFKTSTSPGLKTLELKDFDFCCEAPCRIVDIDIPKTGSVSGDFVEYSTDINRKLVFEAWKNTPFLKDTPDEILNALVAYPESIKCDVKGRAKDN